MRNIVILNSLHFSYPLPILMRVSYNTLIVKQNTSDYYKYSENNSYRWDINRAIFVIIVNDLCSILKNYGISEAYLE